MEPKLFSDNMTGSNGNGEPLTYEEGDVVNIGTLDWSPLPLNPLLSLIDDPSPQIGLDILARLALENTAESGLSMSESSFCKIPDDCEFDVAEKRSEQVCANGF